MQAASSALPLLGGSLIGIRGPSARQGDGPDTASSRRASDDLRTHSRSDEAGYGAEVVCQRRGKSSGADGDVCWQSELGYVALEFDEILG